MTPSSTPSGIDSCDSPPRPPYGAIRTAWRRSRTASLPAILGESRLVLTEPSSRAPPPERHPSAPEHRGRAVLESSVPSSHAVSRKRASMCHDTADVVHAIRRRPSEIRQLRQAVDPAMGSSARSPVWSKPARCCPTGPAMNTSKDCRQWVKNGRRLGRAFPPGGNSADVRAVRVRLRQGRNPTSSCCSTSGTLSSTPSNFSGELC
jgi:hypothetical protein